MKVNGVYFSHRVCQFLDYLMASEQWTAGGINTAIDYLAECAHKDGITHITAARVARQVETSWNAFLKSEAK